MQAISLLLLLLAAAVSEARRSVLDRGNSATATTKRLHLCSGTARHECEKICFNRGRRLVVIDNLGDQRKVVTFLHLKNVSKAYFGLDQIRRRGHLRCSNGKWWKGAFGRWFGGRVTGVPAVTSGKDNCATIDSNGYWRLESCRKDLPSICEDSSSVEAPTLRWTAWCNADKDQSDDEKEDFYLARYVCKDICNDPYDWKCRVAGSEGVSANSTGQHFKIPCSSRGLTCLNSENRRSSSCRDYEVSYLCPEDFDECKANTHSCDKNAQCINTHGSYLCRCNAGYIGDGFKCRYGFTCNVFNGVHIVSFDGAHVSSGSNCNFILTKSCKSSAIPFRVESRQIKYTGLKSAEISAIVVHINNFSAVLHASGHITINSVPLAFGHHKFFFDRASNSSVDLRRRGGDLTLLSNFGLRVNFNIRISVISIFVPQMPKLTLCGLCGNADGRIENDYLVKGSNFTTMNKFSVLKAWLTKERSNTRCKINETPSAAPKGNLTDKRIRAICSPLTNLFTFYKKSIHPSIIKYFSDICSSEITAPLSSGQICKIVLAFHKALISRGIIKIGSYFPPGICKGEIICKENEEFVTLASPCEGSCSKASSGRCKAKVPECRCKRGYVRSGNRCVKYSECGCQDSRGFYRPQGDVWYSNNCHKKHYCGARENITSSGNQCTNGSKCRQLANGDGICVCKQGYSGKSCEDIDECTRASHACHALAECLNTIGSYKCRCLPGYKGNGYNCTDVNECEASPCSKNAFCRNTRGSYLCICRAPYVGDGLSCTIPFIAPSYSGKDFSGCSSQKELKCHPLSICSDLQNGSFACSCPHGALGDGYIGRGHTGCQWADCPEGYQQIEGYCYKFDATLRNHSDASSYCSTLGGMPATFSSNEVASEVKVLLGKASSLNEFWTGYADPKTSGIYPPMDFVGSNWQEKWTNINVTMKNYDFSAIQKFAPEFCAAGVITNGKIKLRKQLCSRKYATLCKVPGSARSCPDGWESSGKYCYFLSERKNSFEDSLFQCALLGSDLVSVPDNDVSKFLYDKFLKTGSISQRYWIGLQNNTLLSPGRFRWWNGGQLGNSYQMWKNENSSTYECVAITGKARWVSRNCSAKLGYICQKKRWALYRCPKNSYYFNGKCYTVLSVAQNFRSHLDQCRRLGGDLISFQSKEEYHFFQKIIYPSQSGPRAFYTGLFLPIGGSIFINSDGDKTAHYKWLFTQTGNVTESGLCTQIIDPSDGIVTIPCSSNLWAVCEYENTPCRRHRDCAANAECFLGQCRCQQGYFGDGKRKCEDVNECQIQGICRPNSSCSNVPGSYKCECNENYELNSDGKCQHVRFCEENKDCNRRAECGLDNLCMCQKGFDGDGKRTCSDINECLTGINNCSSNATCYNKVGGYSCECNNGFTGNGLSCELLPRTCHELRKMKPDVRFPRRSWQKIDPDGSGPLKAMTVSCEMFSDHGITIFSPNRLFKKTYSGASWKKYFVYNKQIEEMKAVVHNSKFCIQEIRFTCRHGAATAQDIKYFDKNLTLRSDWGSGTDGQCLCGVVGLCRNKASSCNCDGTSLGENIDYGYITNRDLLPVRGFKGKASRGTAKHFIGDLRCSEVQFGIPATCDDHPAKWHSNVHLIDPDQRGELEPFPALCFNPHCHRRRVSSITILSHDNFGQRCSYNIKKAVHNGNNPLSYCAPIGQVNLLKRKLQFCSQEIRYDCKNSAIITSGNENSHFYTNSNKPIYNLGHGSPRNHTCPCAALNKCRGNKPCNCDNKDGGWTYDFGWVLKKEHLPIMGFNIEGLGDGSSGKVSVGYFGCSSQQFGIMGNCQMYRSRYRSDDESTLIFRNYDDSYVYPIDPDLKRRRVQPFPVYCQMDKMETGVTIIPNLASGSSACSNTTSLCSIRARYIQSKPQISELIKRSSYCTQKITYRCRQSPILLGINETTTHAYWTSIFSNRKNFGFAKSHELGNGAGCACAKRGIARCVRENLKCLCDSSLDSTQTELITLDNKNILPIESMFVSGRENYVEFGDLQCYDIPNSCHNRHEIGKTLDPEERCVYQRFGPVFILPNQARGGFNPIRVTCNAGGETEIPTERNCIRTTISDVAESSKERCFDVRYQLRHTLLNEAQIRFLTRQSRYCIQYAEYSSLHTPFTGYVRWKGIYGNEHTHWAGTSGKPGCACGITGTCKRVNDACNTDIANSTKYHDRGWFVNFHSSGDAVPVTKMCTKLSSHRLAETKICLFSLRCMESTRLRIPRDCQEARDYWYLHTPRSGVLRAMLINPLQSRGSQPALATCQLDSSPPIGTTIIGTKKCISIGSNGGIFNLTYHGFPKEQLVALIQRSSYCTQRVEFNCKSAAFTGIHAAIGRDGKPLGYWGDNANGTGCGGSGCKCDGNSTWKADNAIFTDKEILPLRSIKLDPAGSDSERRICVHELRCYDIYTDCHSYYAKRGHPPYPNGAPELAIDVDQAGPLEPMSVSCRIQKCRVNENRYGRFGITSLFLGRLRRHSKNFIARSDSAFMETPNYLASIEQATMLADLSGKCWQTVHSHSMKAGLLGAGLRLSDRTGNQVSFFSGADLYQTDGCACRVLGTCPNDSYCHSDASSSSKILSEGTYIINKTVLPITRIAFPKVMRETNLKIYLETMRCAPEFCGLPRHCSEVRKRSRRTSFEQWIQPGSKPFLALCQPSRNDWITRVVTYVTSRNSSGMVEIRYRTAEPDMLKSLVNTLRSCTQAVKVYCRNFKLMTNPNFAFLSVSGARSRRFVRGREQCSCGSRHNCQGSPRQSRTLKCSCDIGDNVTRVDSGIFLQESRSLALLPIIAIDEGPHEGNVQWKVSDLYCGERHVDIDECTLNMNDCDINAVCSEVNINVHQCKCRKGWQGRGVIGVIANGRQCFDDNECALGACGKNTICQNLPGSYRCDCKPGYKHKSPTVCVDINECRINKHNCDVNARCINTKGSFICVCKPGFEGSGRDGDCREVGTCTCWGDPHCRSFDSRILHFQGACSYTLARDSCVNGSSAGDPQWRVVQKNWRRGRSRSRVSWTKEVLIEAYGKKIILRQKKRVVVDGRRVSLPAVPIDAFGNPLGLVIKYFEKSVLVKTRLGFYVKWDGKSRVEVRVDAALKSQVCGICGDYNDDAKNDWTVGPMCEPSRNLTKSARLFGDSWRYEAGMDGKECSPSCSEIPDPVCSGDKHEKAKADCTRLTTIFSDCAREMQTFGESINYLIDSCTFDVCLGGSTLCETAATISALCQTQYNVTTAWRSASFCPMTCGENMHYERCASPCQSTCVNSNASALLSDDCNGRCSEACVCDDGFLLTSGKCVRETECGCKVNGFYYDVKEERTTENCSEKCICSTPGSSSLSCLPYKCDSNAFCGLKDDIYDCHCNEGFRGNGTKCDDIHECQENTDKCSPYAMCNNTVGSYDCTCISGWQGDGIVCDDINECDSSPCNDTTEECHNNLGSYECRCKDGFKRSSKTGNCEDKDECKLNQNRCHRASTDCKNSFGSYSCECKDGYQRVNQYKCKDIDECTNSTLSNCSDYATCTNTPGGYSCDCNSGFSGDGVDCKDVNECENPHACYINATCNNTIGSFYCTCDDGSPGCSGPDPCLDVKCNGSHVHCYRGVCYCENGFKKNITSGLCEDENECLSGKNNCSAINAFCLNTHGSYECQCLPGYTYNPNTKQCEDIDECREKRDDCSSNAICINNVGGYTCECIAGFMGHCEECRDINECEFNLHNCDKTNANCNNTIGSFLCSCKTGFEGNGRVCSDINECSSGKASCPPDATCINSIGSYTCKCSPGYNLNKLGQCTDENECISSTNDCSINAKCVNSQGSYSCTCKPGYFGDGFNCQRDHTDIDCNGVSCHPQATCDNAACKCLAGFVGDGLTCTDINECIKYPGLCDNQANCYNTPGSYSCQCQNGLSGNGFVCYNSSETILACMQSQICVSGTCTDLPDGNYQCECPLGFELKDQECIDINECEDSEACSALPDSECINTVGSYSCICSEGFQEGAEGSNRTCVNINECQINPYACGSNAKCIDDTGGYICECEHGFTEVVGSAPKTCTTGGSNCVGILCQDGSYCKNGSCVCYPPYLSSSTKDGKFVCIQVSDPCTSMNCPNNSVCVSKNGGIACACNPGFTLTPSGECVDIKECDDPLLNTCDPRKSRCIETIGSYTCECIEGFVKNSSGVCVNSNPCDCGDYGVCLRNSSCWCRSGFLEVDGKCKDIDECSSMEQPCHDLALCENTLGSYVCKCPTNYIGDGYNFCDLDECSLRIHTCAANAKCMNTLGSYRCKCLQGFVGDGKTCIQGTNKCLFNNGNCGENALCLWSDNEVTCQCPSGYYGNGLDCYDINECAEGLHQCDRDHGICMNTQGSYTCKCSKGFYGDGITCSDINECMNGDNNCHEDAICENKVGSFTCRCKDGFSGDGVAICNPADDCREKDLCHDKADCRYTSYGYSCLCRIGYEGDGVKSCTDINECELGSHMCVKDASCVNNIGSYSCRCNPGFVGDGSSFCHDVDECLSGTVCNGSLRGCTNLPGGYFCPCVTGAQINPDTGSCEDINECESSSLNICSEHANCTNVQGSFTCACKDGYFGDGISCKDIDECLSGIANCDINALCVNRPGGFDCHCQAGLVGDGKNCSDINECDSANPTHECHPLAKCVNTQPGYRCECQDGYIGSGFFCAKPNPCDTPGKCHANATCLFDGENTHCKCKSGFAGDGVKVCLAENQCVDGTDNCDKVSSTCEAMADGYQCVCKKGFHKVGRHCEDNDECNPSSEFFIPDACGNPLLGICLNTMGGFDCNCTEIAKPEGSGCVPVNPCGDNNVTCHKDASCNVAGSSGQKCQCNEGYVGDGRNCTDIDECVLGTHICNGPASCENIIGSYNCKCPKGYHLSSDGRTCTDIDECARDPTICGYKYECVNTLGSFACDCSTGYQWNPSTKQCEDKNECLTFENPCHENAECINTPGSCTCKCRPGFDGDGIYYCQLSANCSAEISALCPENSVCRSENGNSTCYCPHDKLDYGLDGCNSSVCVRSCKSADPCWTKASRCSPFAKCMTINGTAQCMCEDGFSGNGIICSDVNECAGPNDCDSTISSCKNLDNTKYRLNYTCDCIEGYQQVPGTRKCLNINECHLNASCPEDSTCIDIPGSYYCSCNAGYRATGSSACADIDECAENLDNCDTLSSVCINTEGSFACQCNAGLELINKTHCQDIDECDTAGICGVDQTCHNSYGSYICSCPSGYKANGIYCLDINECDSNGTCDDSAICSNSRGSFKCYCTDGKRMTGGGICEFVNECAEGDNACPDGTVCIDMDNGYRCLCPNGYTNPPGKPAICEDINECIRGLDNCTSSMCINMPGSYKCKCKPGFILEDGVCSDVNECAIANASKQLCLPGSCRNTLGSYICQCPVGYEPLDGACANVNECDLPSASSLAADCPNNEICIDTPGSYRCYCPIGYVKVRGECIDVDECLSANACINGICENEAGNYTCTCLTGFMKVGHNICEDKNECNEIGICGDSRYAICNNTKGGYQCSCKPGSVLVDNKCKKIDVCVERNITCPPHSECTATTFGHTCECKSGFRKDSLGQCVNEDECGRGTHKCHSMALCTDTFGSYKCSCLHGYTGDGRVCSSVCEGACLKHQMCSVTDQNTPKCSCECSGSRCLTAGQVCDSLGRTHNSAKEMYEFACMNGEENTTVSYFSKCKSDCAEISCPLSHVCVFDAGLNKPICKCQKCTPEDISSGPVCSKSRLQFANRCDFIKYRCYWKDDIQLSNTSICRQPISCKVAEWSQWGACSRTCGIGFKVRTRALIRRSQNGGLCPYALTSFAECYAGPCPDGLCRDKSCPIGNICEEVNGKASCRCINCDNVGLSPVCGVVANKTDTYNNVCELKRKACQLNSTFIVHHKGKCGRKNDGVPAVCSVVMNFSQHVFPDGCKSEEQLPLHKCDGGCGKSTTKCCVPLHTRTVTSRYRCPDSSQVIRATKVVTSCHCVEGN